jgi:hypothetical protein
MQYQLHAGNSSIWSTPWCPIWDSIHDHLRIPVTVTPLPAKDSDLWVSNTHDWNIPLLSNIFYDAATKQSQQLKASQVISRIYCDGRHQQQANAPQKSFTNCYPQPTQCSYHNKDQEASAPMQLISCAELGGPKNSPPPQNSHGGSLGMQCQRQREQEDTHKYQDIAAPVVSYT